MCRVDEKLYTGNETAPQAAGDDTSSSEECIPPKALYTPNEPALQAAGEGLPKVLGVGCVPFCEKSPSYTHIREDFLEKGTYPTPGSPDDPSETSPQAASDGVYSTFWGIHPTPSTTEVLP